MQEQENKDNQLGEVVDKVVIAPDDTKSAYDFFKHFKIPMPESLDKALAAFAKDPTIENQKEVKFQICHAIVHVDHEAFKDEMFKKIAEECSAVVYDMQFNKDIAATLSDEDKTNT